MARYSLRMNDELFDFASKQAQKESRSVNGYFVNLVQEHLAELQQEQGGEDSKLDDFINRSNLNYLRQAVQSRENILISGDTASGKTLLLDRIKRMIESNGNDIIECSADDMPAFIQMMNDLRDSMEEGIKACHLKPTVIFIDTDVMDVLDSTVDLMQRFVNLLQLSTQSSGYIFCVARSPLLYIEGLIDPFLDIFTYKFYTTKNKDKVTLDVFTKFYLDEILRING